MTDPFIKIIDNTELRLERDEYQGHTIWTVHITDMESGEEAGFGCTQRVLRGLRELLREATGP